VGPQGSVHEILAAGVGLVKDPAHAATSSHNGLVVLDQLTDHVRAAATLADVGHEVSTNELQRSR
jgi:hypothetical protein